MKETGGDASLIRGEVGVLVVDEQLQGHIVELQLSIILGRGQANCGAMLEEGAQRALAAAWEAARAQMRAMGRRWPWETCRPSWSVLGAEAPVDGASLGLSAALLLLSIALDRALPTGVLASAGLEGQRLVPVKNLPAKWRAAGAAGARRLWVAEGVEWRPKGGGGPELQILADLSAAVAQLEPSAWRTRRRLAWSGLGLGMWVLLHLVGQRQGWDQRWRWQSMGDGAVAQSRWIGLSRAEGESRSTFRRRIAGLLMDMAAQVPPPAAVALDYSFPELETEADEALLGACLALKGRGVPVYALGQEGAGAEFAPPSHPGLRSCLRLGHGQIGLSSADGQSDGTVPVLRMEEDGARWALGLRLWAGEGAPSLEMKDGHLAVVAGEESAALWSGLLLAFRPAQLPPPVPALSPLPPFDGAVVFLGRLGDGASSQPDMVRLGGRAQEGVLVHMLLLETLRRGACPRPQPAAVWAAQAALVGAAWGLLPWGRAADLGVLRWGLVLVTTSALALGLWSNASEVLPWLIEPWGAAVALGLALLPAWRGLLGVLRIGEDGTAGAGRP